MSDNFTEQDDTIAFHPGYYLREIYEDSGETIQEFSKSIGIGTEHAVMLMNGEADISSSTAKKLSKALGTSREYWLNLQEQYDKSIMED